MKKIMFLVSMLIAITSFGGGHYRGGKGTSHKGEKHKTPPLTTTTVNTKVKTLKLLTLFLHQGLQLYLFAFKVKVLDAAPVV